MDVRLTGQDTRRGTFSQRHAVLVDYMTGREHVPLAHLGGEQGRPVFPGGDGPAPATLPAGDDHRAVGRFTVRDSLLSEYAAVGFEYGYSVEAPDALVCWEAQFGDFVNGAEIIIDNFLVAAEEKWDQHAGLTLLLPHGYEGQGPEHSSARIERFLSLGARGNLRVAVPSTAAQYFHLLRSQVRRTPAAPLVVITPKSMLRAPVSRSPIADLVDGAFAEVLDDAAVTEPSRVRRVVLCSGKMALEAVDRRGPAHRRPTRPPAIPIGPAEVAVVRVEQLYPWPQQRIIRGARPLPGGHRGRLVARGAREHGGLVVRPRPPAPPPRGSVLAAPREPGRSRPARPPGAGPSTRWSRPISLTGRSAERAGAGGTRGLSGAEGQ